MIFIVKPQLSYNLTKSRPVFGNLKEKVYF